MKENERKKKERNNLNIPSQKIKKNKTGSLSGKDVFEGNGCDVAVSQKKEISLKYLL